MLLKVHSLRDLPNAAAEVLRFTETHRVFMLSGEMGAGKTTFIKSLCEHLGSTDTFSSPTYSLVNEYQYPKGRIYHFDFFRIKSPTEAYDMGFEEYLYSGDYCFIEWPERIEGLWPENFVEVAIQEDADGGRRISVGKTG